MAAEVRKNLRITKYGRKPRSAVAALKQARAFLVDEGQHHWCKGAIYKADRRTGRQELASPDEALCGNWGVCAIGAVALVSGDLAAVKYPWDDDTHVEDGWNPVAESATDLLNEVAPSGVIVEFNDEKTTKRRDVIRLFDKAIAKAEARK